MIIAAVIVALLLAAAFIPIRLTAEYRGAPRLRLRALFFTVPLPPERKPKPAEGGGKEKADEGGGTKKETPPDGEEAPSASRLGKLKKILSFALEMLGPLRKALRRLIRAENLSLDIRVGSGDAASTAVAVGLLWGAGYEIIALIDRLFRVEAHSLTVTPDYGAAVLGAEGSCILRTNIANIICAAAILGIAFLKYTFKTKFRRNNNERASVK